MSIGLLLLRDIPVPWLNLLLLERVPLIGPIGLIGPNWLLLLVRLATRILIVIAILKLQFRPGLMVTGHLVVIAIEAKANSRGGGLHGIIIAVEHKVDLAIEEVKSVVIAIDSQREL